MAAIAAALPRTSTKRRCLFERWPARPMAEAAIWPRLRDWRTRCYPPIREVLLRVPAAPGGQPTRLVTPREAKTAHLRHAVTRRVVATLDDEDVGEASFLLLRARDRGCPHFRGRESLRPAGSFRELMSYSRPLHGSRRRSVETDPARVAAARPLVRPLLGRACDLGGGLADHLCRRTDPRLSADRVRARDRRAGSTAGRPLPALRTACGRDRRSRRPPPHHGRLQPAADRHPRNCSARRCSRRARRRAGLRRRDRLRDALRLVRRCELRRAAADRRP